ncbi:MAG: hypothetical protein ACFFKA_18875 [Candidatus Thorarchaeota archaeon]
MTEFKNKVSEKFCSGCPVFDIDIHKDNMIENNICLKRVRTECPRE